MKIIVGEGFHALLHRFPQCKNTNQRREIFLPFSVFRSKIGYIRLDYQNTTATKLTILGEKPLQMGEETVFTREAFAQIESYLMGERKSFSLDFSPEGTAFQKEVWRALLEIPYGKTVSYGDLAKKLGREKAYRAVGTACGKNPLLLLIPCHRVITGDGKLGGYAGGILVKETLLNLERKHSHV